MFFIARLLLLWVSLFALGMATLLYCLVDNTPEVTHKQPFSWNEITRTRQLMQGYSVRPTQAGNTPMKLSKRELTLASNYLLKQVANGRTQASLDHTTATVLATIRLPDNPFARYLNARLEIRQGKHRQAIIHKLAIGQLDIAPELATWLIDNLLLNPSIDSEQLLTLNSIKQVKISPHSLSFVYPNVRQLFPEIENTQPIDKQRLKDYQLKLAHLLAQPKAKKRRSLNHVLQPMFQFAKDRSRYHDPIKENQALLLTLNQAFNGNSINSLLPQLATSPVQLQTGARLRGRADLTQHFLGSAALSASTNAQLSNTVGVYKEFKDAYVGSGFSFIDLASDMAGTRFGEMAVESPEKARQLQRMMSQNQLDSLYMPDINNLPENLSALEFNLKYATVNNRRFKRLVKRVERRIDNCPLYQQDVSDKGRLQITGPNILGKGLT